MEIERLVVGQLATNCYLVWDNESRETVIIDPGDDGDYIIRRIQDLALRPNLIVATHGHFDHILAATELKVAFSIPFLIHRDDLFLLRRARASAAHFIGITTDSPPEVDKFIKEGDYLKIGNEKLKAVGTPGHTPGSISLYGRTIIFTGDALFYRGLGRVDFSYSSPKGMERSLKKILALPEKMIVYPGHGPSTTVGEEKDFTFEKHASF